MAGFSNEVVYGSNVDFTGNTTVTGRMVANGQLLIGNIASPNIRVGTLSSSGGTIAISFIDGVNPMINLETIGGMGANSFPTDSGTATPAGGVLKILGDGIVTTSGATNIVTIHGTALATSYPTNSGTAIPSGGVLNVLGASGTITSGSGNTITITSNTSPISGVINLGIKLSGGVFTVTSASGTALSASNPAYVSLQSNVTPGKIITYKITADTSFTDNNGSSTIAGAFFGVTIQNSTTYNTDMPFYLYAVSQTNDSSCVFMIGRLPGSFTSPVAGKIGKTGSTAAASTQGSFFALDNPTVANYASAACMCIGFFRMQSTQRVAAGAGGPPDWVVQTLAFTDGIGNFGEYNTFLTVAGAFGATSGKYFLNQSGTAPTFTSNAVNYSLFRDGFMNLNLNFSGCNNTGTGSDPVSCAIPFSCGGNAGSGIITSTTAVTTTTVCAAINVSNNQTVIFYYTGVGHLLTVGNGNMTSALNDGILGQVYTNPFFI